MPLKKENKLPTPKSLLPRKQQRKQQVAIIAIVHPSIFRIFAIGSLFSLLFGDSVGIEDGSIWQVSPFDTDLVHCWCADDVVTITQNRHWFSSYQYRIVNKNNGASIAVNLSLGPIIDGEHSLQITNIDHYNDLLVLSDRSQWKISSRDRYLFSEWTLGDYIILGVNSGWDSSCPFILINSNMNNHLRAKQY